MAVGTSQGFGGAFMGQILDDTITLSSFSYGTYGLDGNNQTRGMNFLAIGY